MMVCLFCANARRGMIEIFGESGKVLETAEIISKYFWFKLDEVQSKEVCKICWRKIISFHLFYCEVEQYHKTLFLEAKPELTIKIETEEAIEEVITEIITAELLCIDVKHESSSELVLNTKDNKEPLAKNLMKIDENVVPTKRKRELVKKDENTNQIQRERAYPSKFKQPRATWLYTRKHEYYTLIPDYFVLQCNECDTKFSDWGVLRLHYLNEHKKKGVAFCKICKTNQQISYLSSAVDHIEYHKNPNAFKCDVCAKVYDDRYKLRNHTIEMHLRRYECHYCGKKFHRSKIEDHMLLKHINKDERPFPCPHCSNHRFVSKTHLDIHIKMVHKELFKTVCEICAQVCSSKGSYKTHLKKIHSGNVLTVQCSDCGKSIKEYNMKVHLIRCPNREDKSGYVCKICSKIKPSKAALERHVKVCHNQTPLPCLVCGKIYQSRQALKEHTASHTGIPLYICSICNKEFNCKSNKYVHFKKMHPAEWAAQKKT